MTLPKGLEEAWRKADENDGLAVPVGRHVVCDICSGDWTDRPESGGFVFGSYSYCPDCGPTGLRTIDKYDERAYVKAYCPADMSFADFIRKFRGPNAFIRISKGGR